MFASPFRGMRHPLLLCFNLVVLFQPHTETPAQQGALFALSVRVSLQLNLIRACPAK